MVNILLEADRLIAEADPDDPHAFYSLLHDLASLMARVDAFYVAIYSACSETLTFSYNVDDGVYDEPCALPLGDGPTSWVVRNNAPVWWNNLSERSACVLIPFGETERPSASAVHLPMRGMDGLRGVMSAQSYHPGAYPAAARRMLQWLADQAGRAMARRDERHAMAAREEGIERRQLLLADRFAAILKDLEEESGRLLPLVRPENLPLFHALNHIRHACRGHRTRVSEIGLHLPPGAGPPSVERPAGPDLSEREWEILRMLASGASNVEIAASLYISVNTVKYHCKAIFRKMGVRNRTEAVLALSAATHLGGPKTTPSGDSG